MVKVLAIDPSRPDPRAIDAAAQVILNGGIVAYPTETVYGLAVDPFNKSAVLRLFAIKSRPKHKALILLIASTSDLSHLARDVSRPARALIKQFWPGPLTLILKKGVSIRQPVSAANGTVAVRISSHPVARELVRRTGRPITATSANRSGVSGHRTARAVIRDIGTHALTLVLDAGKTPLGGSSTLVDTTLRPPRVLRNGVVAKEKIFGALYPRRITFSSSSKK